MFINKFAFHLSLAYFCLILLESPQTGAVRLQKQLYDGLTNADSLDDPESQLIFEELSRFSPEFQRRIASKRGFVRLG